MGDIEAMKEYILDALETADPYTVQQIYWFLNGETEDWKEVIPYLIQRKGGMYALLYR